MMSPSTSIENTIAVGAIARREHVVVHELPRLAAVGGEDELLAGPERVALGVEVVDDVAERAADGDEVAHARRVVAVGDLRERGRGDEQEEQKEGNAPAHSRIVIVKGTSALASPSRSKARNVTVTGPGGAVSMPKVTV